MIPTPDPPNPLLWCSHCNANFRPDEAELIDGVKCCPVCA